MNQTGYFWVYHVDLATKASKKSISIVILQPIVSEKEISPESIRLSIPRQVRSLLLRIKCRYQSCRT